MWPAFWPFRRHQRQAPAHSQHLVHARDKHRVFPVAPTSSPPPPPPPSSPSQFDTSAIGSPSIPARIAAKIDSNSDCVISVSPQHRRPDGCAHATSSTTPYVFESSPTPAKAQSCLQLKATSQQQNYPIASLDSAAEPAAFAVAAENREHQAAASRHHNTDLVASSPFRKHDRKGKNLIGPHRSSRPSASRLWNPTNSTPRIPQQHRQRERTSSTPPPPTVLLQHPALSALAEANDRFAATAAGSYPLLTLSEQRQSRHTSSTPTTLQIDRTGASDRRISLPRSFRPSLDGQRYHHPRTSVGLDATQTIPGTSSCVDATNLPGPSAKSKGKQKATMATSDEATRSCSRDLERGPDVVNQRISAISAAEGIGSSLSSSNSSIMGEDVQPDAGEEWGPQHPCFPHMNPHVPLDSMEYATTRIIRVKRDWLVAGDLAPTFSNLYPEILDPAGVSEQEFRRVVEKLNAELIPIFDPFGFRNMLDSVLGLVTGWLWDDFGLTAAKSRLNNLEKWMERWNLEMEKTMSSEEGVMPPKLIPLRRTGYMSLDIQIPDPEIAPAPSSVDASDSRIALPLEPMPAMTTER
ncbi:hypothetical protein E4U43_007768 [Claviceps pusilla]|uniref:Ras modification protein ERF4 n=1 Tax=Claviceps pusilla TaxID=123648 RepID=A0A9P7T123_9HYPO|nr:hypothetical protein E4U43_007768 [Claviceps pusilla]